MSQGAFLRFASPSEQRTISREDLGYYNAVIVAGIYDWENVSPPALFAPLKECIQKHSYLSVIITDTGKDKSAFERVSSIDMNDHIVLLPDNDIEKALPSMLDRPFIPGIPPWRIFLLPERRLIAFAYSHAIGDGICGTIFHRTFSTAKRGPSSSMLQIPPHALSEPFDIPKTLPISWSYLLSPVIAVYLPFAKMLGFRAAASTITTETWTGSTMKTTPIESKIKMLEIESDVVQRALQHCRKHNSKLTSLLHSFICQALAKGIPAEYTNFVSCTAVDMRGAVSQTRDTWGLYVSGYYHVHYRASPVDLTENLAKCAHRLQDQAIGLLRYLPSIRKWTVGKIGQSRDSSYEISNLTVFDSPGISKMIFAQPANVTSSPLVFSVISVKNGSLVCTITWQQGALAVPINQEEEFVTSISASIEADFAILET